MKPTERTRIRRAIAILWNRGKWQAALLVSTLKHLKKEQIMSDQSCTPANILQPFSWPQPGTGAGGATDAPWGHQTHQQVSLQDHSKKGRWTCHIHEWSQLQLVESGNCFGGHGILAFCILSCRSLETSPSGSAFVVPWTKVSTTIASHIRLRPLYQRPKSIHPVSFRHFSGSQAPR